MTRTAGALAVLFAFLCAAGAPAAEPVKPPAEKLPSAEPGG